MGVILKNGIYYSGPPGTGIARIQQNADYTLTITLTDGTSYTTQPVKGEKGASIEAITFNSDSTISFEYDDGSVFTSPVLNFLPPVTTADTGKTLIVNETGMWDTEDVSFETWTKYSESATPSPSPQNPVIIADRLPIATPEDAGKGMIVDEYGAWQMMAVDYLPGVTAADFDKVLKVDANGNWVVGANSALPTVTAQDEGSLLTVDSNGEWIVEDIPLLPEADNTDAGKVVGVNSSGEYELMAGGGGSGLPAVSTSDAGKVLTVNSQGAWAAQTPSGGSGSGLPSVGTVDDGKILMVVDGAWAVVTVEFSDDSEY